MGVGDKIVLTGLKTASYNGEHGKIHRKVFNPADGCPLWELELTGPNYKGETIRVPCHNVKRTKFSQLLAKIERDAKYERISILEKAVKEKEEDVRLDEENDKENKDNPKNEANPENKNSLEKKDDEKKETREKGDETNEKKIDKNSDTEINTSLDEKKKKKNRKGGKKKKKKKKKKS